MDDKRIQSRQDHTRASSQGYEVAHFAQQHGLTVDRVRELIAAYGNRQDTLERIVGELGNRKAG